LRGIHLHIGSQNPNADAYAEAFVTLFENLLIIFKETGHRLSHLNLGGGFPVNYLRDESNADDFSSEQRAFFAAELEPVEVLREAWNVVKKTAKLAGAEHLLENIELLVEPGRSVISDAGICLTTVRNKKQRPLSKIPKSRISNPESRHLAFDRRRFQHSAFDGNLQMVLPSDFRRARRRKTFGEV
jgi:diaminopimelate decarboxylase